MSGIKKEYGWNQTLGISLYDKIRHDMKSAMIKKDTAVRDTMRLIMGDFPSLTVPITMESGKKTTRVKKPEEITDDDLLNIIRKFVKSEKAVRKAEQKVKRTLAASLRLKKGSEVVPIEIKSNVFRPGRKEPLILVQKREARLAARTEVQEIISTRRKSLGIPWIK